MFKRSLIYISVLSMLPISSALAAEGGKLPFELFNRLRIEYDDNIRQTKEDESDSLKIIEDVEFIVNSQKNNTFIGLRYNPSFVYWDDRDEDDTDFHHQLDLSLNQDFSDRFRVSVKDVFRLAELPELIESGAVTREKNDYIYNSVVGRASYNLTEALMISGNARHVMLEYDDATVALESDYDKVVLGADVNFITSPQTQIGLEFRYSEVEYEVDNRNSDSTQIGAMFNTVLSPQLQLNLRGGVETKNFEDANSDSSDTPYVSGAINITQSDVLQFNVGGSFSFADTAFEPFVNQERTAVFAGATVKLSPRVVANFGLSYSMSSYDAEDTTSDTDVATVTDGDEEALRISAQATYEVNRSNWLEIGWQMTELTTDVRPNSEFTRNRAHIGWKLKI